MEIHKLDEAPFWKSRRRLDPEVEELLKTMESWDSGVVYEIKFDKPHKSLPGFLYKYFKGKKTVRTKAIDGSFQQWKLALEVKKRKSRKGETAAV